MKKGVARSAEDDDEVFARAMADVVRLAPDRPERVRAAPPAIPRHRANPPASSPAVQGAADGSTDSYVAPGVDRRELRKLKRGDHAVGGRLDLHGHTARAAVAIVKQFLGHSHRRHRCVCIVHGRGLHSPGNVAILKTIVRDCLRRHPTVLAFADAPRGDGGAGAVYVLLRK